MTELAGPQPPAAAPDIAWWQPAPVPPVHRTSQYVPARDGTRLAVDVYLPQLPDGARVPAIVVQTRYFRRYAYHAWAERIGNLLGRQGDITPFVIAGYAVVVVDARGSGASFGHRTSEISDDEVADGADVCDWIVAQPWSSGVIGSTGVSYEGSTAESLLRNRHPAVKASIPRYALFDSFPEIFAPGGIRSNWFIHDWGELVRAKDRNEEEPLLPKIDAGGIMAVTLPLTAGVAPVDEDTDGCLLAQAIDDHRNNYDLLAATSGIEFRDDGPSRFGLEGTDHSIVYHLDDIRASGAVVYSWVGWYDGAYVNSAVKRFIALRNQGARLILGPWDHGNRQLPDPTTAVAIPSFDHHGEMLRFFDHHLKGASTGIESEPPVHYFTVGEGRWKSCDDWPPPGYDPLSLYFGPDGALGHEEPGEHSGEDTYTVDFRSSSGTGSRWRTQANFAGAVIGWPDRAEQDSRLLVYDSSPLDSDLEVTGHPHVEIHMTIDTIDTAVHAYLEEVTPQGEVRHVTEGMLRAINREEAEPPNEWDRLEPYHTFLRADARLCEPGETFTLRFGLIACSYLFRAGSRIRLALAGADADNFERIPTSGAAPNWRVQRTATYPSRVVLPARKR